MTKARYSVVLKVHTSIMLSFNAVYNYYTAIQHYDNYSYNQV